MEGMSVAEVLMSSSPFPSIPPSPEPAAAPHPPHVPLRHVRHAALVPRHGETPIVGPSLTRSVLFMVRPLKPPPSGPYKRPRPHSVSIAPIPALLLSSLSLSAAFKELPPHHHFATIVRPPHRYSASGQRPIGSPVLHCPSLAPWPSA
jgi:hypothetical protein